MLIHYRDGELPRNQVASVEAHLAGCQECREECQRLRDAINWVRDQVALGMSALPASAPATLRDRLRESSAERERPDRCGAVLRHRIAAEIAPFLGQHAADTLLEPVSDDGRDLLSIIEPVLADFLGERAAAELVSHLAETAMKGA